MRRAVYFAASHGWRLPTLTHAAGLIKEPGFGVWGYDPGFGKIALGYERGFPKLGIMVRIVSGLPGSWVHDRQVCEETPGFGRALTIPAIMGRAMSGARALPRP